MNFKDKVMKDLTVEEYLTVKLLEALLTFDDRDLHLIRNSIQYGGNDRVTEAVERILKPYDSE